MIVKHCALPEAGDWLGLVVLYAAQHSQQCLFLNLSIYGKLRLCRDWSAIVRPPGPACCVVFPERSMIPASVDHSVYHMLPRWPCDWKWKGLRLIGARNV